MHSVEETLPKSRVRLTVTVPAAETQRVYKKMLKTWNAKVTCDGYRKGKAPEAELIKELGGQERVNNSVLSEVLESAMAEALASSPRAERAISDSEVIEQDGDALEKSFQLGQDFTFSVVYDTLPEVEWTTSHRDLAVVVESASSEAADAAKVEAKMRALLKETGTLRVTTGRGVRRGDVAIIDFAASLADTGKPIPGAARSGMRLDTEVGDQEFIPGVVDALEGMAAGEERDTTITFPTSEDFQPAQLRGAEAKIHVKVSEIFEWDLPETTDEWAAQVMGAPGSTVADVRTRLVENTAAESESATRRRIADAFTEAVAAAVKVDLPDSLVTEAGRNEYSRELNELLQKGLVAYEQMEQLAAPQLVEAYVARKRPELEELQRSVLGFADILRLEGVELDSAAVEAEFENALESVGRLQKDGEVNREGLLDQVVNNMENQAAMDWLIANCSVTINPKAD